MTRPDTKRLLIGEDDPAQREVLAEVLALEGFEPVLAGRPEEVLAALRTRPDLAVLDLVGISTPEVREALSPSRRTCPLVLVSGSPELPKVAALLRAGWLDKPYEVDELLALIRQLLPQAGLANAVSVGI
jgi:DNA-binding response OmpR family regulator